MKDIIYIVMLALLAIPAVVAEAEQFVAVELVDNVKQTTHQILSPAEYKNLQEDVIQKNSLLSRAVKLAQEEWNTITAVENSRFPQGVGTPAKVKLIGLFMDKAKAEAAIADAESREPDEDAPKSTYMKKKVETLKEALKNPPNDTPTVSRQTWINSVTEELKMMEGIITKREAKQDKAEKLKEMAVGLVVAALAKLQDAEKAELTVDKKKEK